VLGGCRRRVITCPRKPCWGGPLTHSDNLPAKRGGRFRVPMLLSFGVQFFLSPEPGIGVQNCAPYCLICECYPDCRRVGPVIARAVHRPGQWGSGRRSARWLERLGNLLPERLSADRENQAIERVLHGASEAEGVALQVRPLAALDQEQEPKCAGSETRSRGGLGTSGDNDASTTNSESTRRSRAVPFAKRLATSLIKLPVLPARNSDKRPGLRHLRQIGADQVAALVRSSGVSFRAIAPKV
jgi:hypothetical protein